MAVAVVAEEVAVVAAGETMVAAMTVEMMEAKAATMVATIMAGTTMVAATMVVKAVVAGKAAMMIDGGQES